MSVLLSCFTLNRRRLLVAGVLAGVMIVGVVGVLGWVWLKGTASVPRVAPPLVPGASVKDQVVLRDFSNVKYTDDGREAFRIKIGECVIRPNEAAFWNPALSKIAEMTGVRLDVFGGPPAGSVAPPQTAGVAIQPPAAVQQSSTSSDPSAVIRYLMELRRSGGWESVGYFVMRDVTINLHEGKTLATGIKARKLSPESKGQFVLDGNVLITANDGRRLLATDRAIWWPTVGIFAVKERYSLNDAGQERQGRRTIFKQSLEPVTDKAQIDEYQKRAQQKGASEP